MQKYISRVLKAIKQFNMIDENDVVAVGVSGGKDSMLTVTLLHEIAKFSTLPNSPVPKFKIIAISLDCTGGKATKSGAYNPTIEYLKNRGIELKIVPCDVLKIIFEDRNERSPCSLCANLRRGILNSSARELGANKVALGHHADDFIETFFLNLIYGGHPKSFEPFKYFDKADITQIRPMLYMKESEIISFGKTLDIPILDNCCQVNGKTQRQFVKEELARLEKLIPGSKDNIFKAAIGQL